MASTAAGTRHLAVISALEQLALVQPDRRWRQRLSRELGVLSDWLDTQDDHEREIGRDAPRLIYLTRRLGHQRDHVTEHLDRLLRGVFDMDDAQLERRLRQLLREARRYRRGLAELLYQAYEVDLGGEH